MTDHAGPRRCECHPGTKFWHPPVEVTKFWHPFPFFKDQTKINSSVWNKSVTWTISNNFCFILFPRLLINIIFFGLTKKTGAKTAPRVPKLGYFDGRVPKVSSRVTLATSGPAWSVTCAFISMNYIYWKLELKPSSASSKLESLKCLNCLNQT